MRRIERDDNIRGTGAAVAAITAVTLVACLLVSGVLGSCASSAKPIHAGAVNALDSELYDGLMTAQGALDGAKIEVATMPNKYRIAVNEAGAAYDLAQKAYKAYHVAAVAAKSSGGLLDPAFLEDFQTKLRAAAHAYATAYAMMHPEKVLEVKP